MAVRVTNAYALAICLRTLETPNRFCVCPQRNARGTSAIRLSRRKGFTLIELMIVVAVVAILLAIAIPTYENFMFRARRVDGKNLLQQVAAAEERYNTNFNKYTDDLAALGVSNVAASMVSAKRFYLLTVSVTNAPSFTLSAAPQGIQVGDLCGTLTLSDTGQKGPTDAAANSNGTCL